VEQEPEETLKHLGLSGIQARVYLTLIRSGRSSAKMLSKQSGVARPDIYRIMNYLQQLGIVQKIIANPVMFEATPIEHALSGLIDDKVEEIKSVKKKTQSLIRELKLKQNHKNINDSFEPNIFLIPATKIALQKRKELIENAKYSINVISSWRHYKILLNSNFNELTKKAIDRGVKYRLVIETPKSKLPAEHHEALKILGNNGSSLKFAETNPLNIISIYDNKEVLILMSEQTDTNNSPLLWSNNSSIVSIANCYFENLWKIAKDEPN
jgi:sugar-specific transcriptional regulator TrmB